MCTRILSQLTNRNGLALRFFEFEMSTNGGTGTQFLLINYVFRIMYFSIGDEIGDI